MSPRFALTVWSFLSLSFGAAGSPSSWRGGSWFLGCVHCSGELQPDCSDLDPVLCSAFCQRKGCSVAAVSLGGCFCGDQELMSCPSSDCPNHSTQVMGRRAVLLPVGEGQRNVALYQTSGPFLDTLSLSVSPDLIFTNTTFTVRVSGKLAAPLNQTTGIFGLERHNLSDVTVEFLGMTPRGQSSLHVNILDRGSFNVSSNWTLETPGTYEIRVTVSNILSEITASLNLIVLAQRADGLVKVWHRVDSECDWCLTQREKTSSVKITCINSTQSKTVKLQKEKRDSFHTGNVVEVHAAKQAYPTNTPVLFSAVTEEQDSVEFLWQFGDSTSARHTLKTITKKYRKPGRYNVTVVMVTPRTSTISDIFPVVIQKAVKLNRLVHQASVLQHHPAELSCRVNTGTDLNFLWTFGDGWTKTGQSAVQHVFHRQFTVEVTAFNLVSSASLKSHIFVVDTACQPPPVKNMGPLTVKVPRYEPIRFGVTYESEFDCDILIFGGVQYTWTLYDSMGQVFPLPHIETNRQTLALPSHFLHSDTYTAVAKVKVVGSVVYSNYSVNVQVINSAPVAIIRGATNVFINNKNTTVVTLDGTKSYDPDFPHNTPRFSWTCKPMSSISSSCFDRDVHLSSAVASFPASFLKINFDQFHFTLTIESAGRSASSDVFITVTTDLQEEVSIDCPQCQSDKVNWDQPFSVQAFCERSKTHSNLINYSWSLHQVNASSRPISEIPFCYTVDLGAPSSIKDTFIDSDLASRSLRHWRSNFIFIYLYSDNYSNNYNELATFDFVGFHRYQHFDSFLNAEEGESKISPGRTTVEDGESFILGEDLEFDPGSHREEGSNLVHVRPHVAVQEPTLLDLPRDPVPRWVFESYTYTGISSSQLHFKPFSLRPGSRYMLEVIATQTHGKSKQLNHTKQFVGQSQFFFQTKPAPKGMTCQVQPTNGVELITVFSVFCTSGREDLLYKYSFSVGHRPPQTLYQGSDFEHYFSLPAGDSNDDYKVTISIEIRSSIDGGATRPCPASVTVLPQFVRNTSSFSDPALNLSQIALKNLSRRLGNSLEILNYIHIVTNILNRLSLEPEVNMKSLVFLRNALVCVVCDINTIDQFYIKDTIDVLKNLLQITSQVMLTTISKVTAFTNFIAKQRSLEQKTLNNMISLLSHNLKTVTYYDYQKDITKTATEMKLFYYNLVGNSSLLSTINSCLSYASGSMTGLTLAKHLVDNILHIITDLSLKFLVLNKNEEFKLRTDLVSVYATYQRTTDSCGFCVFHLPQSFVRRHDNCVIIVVTELNQNSYFWANDSGELTGSVIELKSFRCNTQRKISNQFFVEPFEIELRLPEKQIVTSEYILHPSNINYHSFNISHEHLQHVIQLHLHFTPPATRVFPVLLLFRMFAKPTPSQYHSRQIHSWEKSIIRMTLPSSQLSAGGVGYFALLNADFEKPHRWRNIKVSYRMNVDKNQCLSWEAHRGTWTPHSCRTQTADTTSTVKCSCHRMHPVTLTKEQIATNLTTGDTRIFLNVAYNWTVVIVMVLGVSFYIGALVLSPNADVVSGERKMHYLPDNFPCEPFLYAVTIHTGHCSATEMSAKVYIVLCGEDGFTQTKELQVPGCTFFGRNSQDTFIVSSAESLGSLCAIKIWHDNSGPNPNWYLKHVEVSEVNRDRQAKGRTWLFDSQCWLSVDRSDGKVERRLTVYNGNMSFAKMVNLKVCNYMADFHMWRSIASCPNTNSLTRRQRLSICVLLWLGYSCVSALIISHIHDKINLEVDIKNVSMNAVTSGILSVTLVLPFATFLSFVFRLSQVKRFKSAPMNMKTEGLEDASSLNNTLFELHFSWDGLQHWVQESWRKKYQDANASSVSSWCLDAKIIDDVQNNVAISKEDIIVVDNWSETEEKEINADSKTKQNREDDLKICKWLNYATWAVWLLLCMSCLASSAVLGLRFTHKEAVFGLQSLFISLLFCIFFIHPLMIFAMALIVLIRHRKSMNTSKYSTHLKNKLIYKSIQNYIWGQTRNPTLLKLLQARQRLRFLRLVQPPTVTELRKSRWVMKRERRIHQTVRDWFVFASLFFLMLCVTYGSSFNNYYTLNREVKKHYTSGNNSFMWIKTYDDWWRWAQTNLIDTLYKKTSKSSTFQNAHILIGEPVMWKTEARHLKALNSTLLPNCYKINLKKKTSLFRT
ncbi:hypothetical protein WMY93_030748 [Mugilogobius chulae]|uniref:Polycystic kidney disease protein 1-like 1 n=1 Tax=Mugilogobius chulae TaxID=88201 RepID=A0AAW0MH08_9GOBI